jgi:translation initiation factor 1
MSKKDKLVYSTRTGDGRPLTGRAIDQRKSLPPAQQTIRVRREVAGRRGKTVTVAFGFTLTAVDLKALGKMLKNSCGTGGTTKTDGDTQIVEIQGDHRDQVVKTLESLGYRVKLAGG